MPANVRTFLACAILLMFFAATSWSAISSKGATYDEPYHALAGWLQLHQHDYRMDNEDPPLWMYFASLPNGKDALKADFDSPYWKQMPAQLTYQWYWGVNTLYRTAGNDPVAFVHRCRLMMLIAAILLGVCIARWSFELAGPVGAVVATAAFSLDPNFLAHASLMKNDIVFSLSMFCLARALWKAGQSLTLWRAVWISMLCVFTLSVKFTGIVAVSLVPLLLGLRALSSWEWPVMGYVARTRWKRLVVVAVLGSACAGVSFGGIWAMYGFRFRPTPQRGVYLNMTDIAWEANRNQIVAHYGDIPPAGVSMQAANGPVINAVLFANKHGLLPQAYLAGFLFTYANALVRPAFLLGKISVVGWWYYFPAVMLMKTPLATIAAAVITAIVILRRRSWASWSVICLAVPFAVFLGAAMRSNFNIGIRHIMPIYPYLFVAIGCAANRLWSRRSVRIGVASLGLLLATESLGAYPNFIPFFNIAATQLDGGKLNLLGDSNLDWGQDLPLLADWQRANPNIPLYLSYFGYEDPAFYHIRYTPLPGGYHYDPPPRFPLPTERCVLAISATNLQGVLEPPPLRGYYAQCQKLKLIDVLGGTIYLFEYDPSRPPR